MCAGGKMKLSRVAEKNLIKQSPIRKIMEMANPKKLKEQGIDPTKIISFAGGWVNHEAPDALRDTYLHLCIKPSRFHEMGAYSPTDGLAGFKQALVRLEKKLYDLKELSENNIIVGQSSTQLLTSLILTLSNAGDKIVLFDPTYANYPEQIAAVQRSTIICHAFNQNEWKFRNEEDIFDDIKVLFEKEHPKILLFSSPDNPTGHIFSDNFVRKLLALGGERGVFIIIDQAYRDFVFDNETYEQFSFSPVEFDNLILVNSNSKWCRGLGRRLGWVKASEEVINAMKPFQQTMILCPDTLHQRAMELYLQHSVPNGLLKEYLHKVQIAYKETAKITMEALNDAGIEYLKPKGGLYIVANVKQSGERFVKTVLKKYSIMFVPGEGFGTTLKNGIRISFGPLADKHEDIKKGINAIAKEVPNDIKRKTC